MHVVVVVILWVEQRMFSYRPDEYHQEDRDIEGQEEEDH